MTRDVIVVGGGIVGSSAAYHLARDGADVLLCDRADEGRATTAGAGIVSPATSSRTESTEWFEFALDAAEYYPKLATALDEAGSEHGYAKTGLLSVAMDDQDAEAFERARRRTDERVETYERLDAESIETVSAERARELYPPLGETERARYFADAARVDGAQFAAALRGAGEDAGLTIEASDVTGIRTAEGSVTGVQTAAGETYEAEAVILAGGAWSPELGDDLGVSLPISPQRGQITHVAVDPDPDERPPAEWPIVTSFRHHYQVPWSDGRVACGATREDGVGFEPQVTFDGVREVAAEALRVAPGLADAEPVETRVGLRPIATDGLPIVGEVPTLGGAFVATAHGPTGLTLGPHSGRVVAELAQGNDPGSPIEPFAVDRFGR